MQQIQQFDNKDALIKHAVKKYHALQYLPQLRDLLRLINPEEEISHLCKFELHKRLNSALMGRCSGEFEIKHALFEEFRQKDLIAAFEMNVDSSRLDFLTINGVTTSYEIKSSLDTLGKLQKQSAAYHKAFEFNNIILDERHLYKAFSIVPSDFGIHTFLDGKIKIIRRADYNHGLDANFQLRLLSKKELVLIFKSQDLSDILINYSKTEINDKFKQCLKSRYKDRWQFITSRADEILPLDVQFFFNSNVEPRHIYSIN